MNKMMNDKYISLYSNCIPVKGYKRSVICDFQRWIFKFIPNGLYEILNNYNHKSIQELLNDFSNDEKPIILEYLDFLEQNEFICYLDKDESELFPKINLKWLSPSTITNSIIDIENTNRFNYKDIVEQLEKLGCLDIKLRFYSSISINELERFLTNLHYNRLKSIQLVLPNIKNVTVEDIENFQEKFNLITSFIIYNSNKRKVSNAGKSSNIFLAFINKDIKPSFNCGNVSKEYFVCNLNSFCEALKFNSCLNRKISIDITGKIKNCPSMKVHFGNINNTSLSQVLDNKEFKKIWYISKDKIEVCKHCEFRYICPDCRAFIVDSSNIYSRPLKCTYNPYIAKWKTEKGWISPETWLKAKKTGNIN